MKNLYKVHFSGYFGYDVEVFAESKEEAQDIATPLFENSDVKDFHLEVEGADASIVGGYRLIKLYAGMTGEFEIIDTNAPDSVIKAQLTYTSALEEERKPVENPYSIIEAMGYEVQVLGSQDTCSVEDLKNMSFDAEFDYYEY